MPLAKVQEMIGHLSKEMTEHYTQIKDADLDEITTVQENMLKTIKKKRASKKWRVKMI